MNGDESMDDSQEWDEEYDPSESESSIESEESDSSEGYNSSELAQDVCVHDAVNSSLGPVSLGCNVTCLEAKFTSLPNNSICVLNVTHWQVKLMPDYRNFSCLLGTCSNGSCKSPGNTSLCEKFPVMSVGVQDLTTLQ
uniref:Evasin n=1 Tax=Rhipicephalus appendiculatus TaxID=34631 RepID=A0A131YEX1_RHIAP